MSTLPTEPSILKKIDDAIEEAVASKVKELDAKSHQKDIANRIEEDTGMKASEFNKRVNIRYKRDYKPTAFENEREWNENVYEEDDLLKRS